MKRLLFSFAICVMPLALLGFQADPANNAGSVNGYEAILKRAMDSVKVDGKGKIVQIANLESYKRQNDTSSVRPIRESDVMFKVRLWSKINFKEKINSNFTSYESDLIEIIYEGVEAYYNSEALKQPPGDARTRLLDEALKNGELIIPYKAQETEGVLYSKSHFVGAEGLSPEDYDKAITDLSFQGANFTDAGVQSTWETQALTDFPDLSGTALTNKAEELFNADQQKKRDQAKLSPANGSDLDQILVEEDLIFDRNHSLPVWDIISFTVFSPSTASSQSGLFKVEYKQLKKYIDRVYKESDAERAFWFNTNNPGDKGLSFADAVEKRLFNAYIVSVENVNNENLLDGRAQGDLYNSLLFAEKVRLQLLERVHNLWEY